MTQEITRQLIFAQAAKKLRTDFDELKATIPHSGLKGTEGEQLVRTFLNGHLPSRFRAGAGFVIDRRDRVSRQSDVIVYDALNCPTYRASAEAGIYPSDNVAAVIEVKANLDKQRLEEAADNIAVAKSLAKTPVPENLPFLLQWETIGCVFAFSSPLSLDKVAEHYVESIRKLGGLRRHIDAIAILDVGMITLAAKPPGAYWAPSLMLGPGGGEAEGSHIAVGATPFGDATLDVFLRFLLPHLTNFRGMSDHPGFQWAEQSVGDTKLTYLTSVTRETDPEEKKQTLAKYREQVVKEFAKSPQEHK